MIPVPDYCKSEPVSLQLLKLVLKGIGYLVMMKVMLTVILWVF
jgi:hypothetical protein